MRNPNFKKALKRMALARGQRPRLQTKIVNRNIRKLRETLRLRDQLDN